MVLFTLRQTAGLYYPVILTEGSTTPENDDAAGGDLSRTETINRVRQLYGNDARYVTQQGLADEVNKRLAKRQENRFQVADYPPVECGWIERECWGR